MCEYINYIYTHACTDTCACMWSYICVGVWKCTSRLTVHVVCMPHTIICVYTRTQHTHTIILLVHLHTYTSSSGWNFSFFLLIFLRILFLICFSVSSSKMPWYSHFKNISQIHRCWGVGGQPGHTCASVEQMLTVGTPDTFRGWLHRPVQCERGLRGGIHAQDLNVAYSDPQDTSSPSEKEFW